MKAAKKVFQAAFGCAQHPKASQNTQHLYFLELDAYVHDPFYHMFYLCLLGLFSREERCYVSGRLDGPAKYFYTSGAVETRIYENGALQGISRKFKNEPPRIFFQINFALKAKMRNRYKNVKIRETGQTNMGMEFFARVSRQNLPPIIFLENLNLKIMLELHFHGLQELRFTGLGPSAETTAPKL